MRTLAVLGVLLIGCGTSAAPHFDAGGFRSVQNSYGIPYVEGTTDLIDSSWRVANFRYVDGRPGRMLDKGEWLATFDWTYANGEVGEVSAPIYDLELSHTSNAHIWVRVVPVPEELRNKDVSVLLENYANNLSGTAATSYFSRTRKERRFATKILESNAVGFLGRTGHQVQFDLVSLDQLEMDENAPRTRVELVLVKTAFLKTLSNSHVFDTRGYLMLGYANDAGHFAEHLSTFRRFAKRIHRIESP